MSLPLITRLAAVEAAAADGLLVMDATGSIVVLDQDGRPVFDASEVVDRNPGRFELAQASTVIRVTLRGSL